jgi:hypothetical protein
MMGHQLETIHHFPYLGVELSKDLGWEIHKANRTLGFSEETSIGALKGWIVICHVFDH